MLNPVLQTTPLQRRNDQFPAEVSNIMVIDLKFNTWALTASLLLCIVACIGHSLYQRRYRAPGPPRLPLLGNILQHPTQLHFIQYTKWAKEYGTFLVPLVC